MGQREVEDSYLRGAILAAVTVSPKAALLGVSRKAAGCLQGGDHKAEEKEGQMGKNVKDMDEKRFKR